MVHQGGQCSCRYRRESPLLPPPRLPPPLLRPPHPLLPAPPPLPHLPAQPLSHSATVPAFAAASTIVTLTSSLHLATPLPRLPAQPISQKATLCSAHPACRMLSAELGLSASAALAGCGYVGCVGCAMPAAAAAQACGATEEPATHPIAFVRPQPNVRCRMTVDRKSI